MDDMKPPVLGEIPNNITAKLLVFMTTEGKLEVQGDINNKMQAFGMLELAKEAISLHHQAKARQVQLASPSLTDQLIANMKKGNI